MPCQGSLLNALVALVNAGALVRWYRTLKCAGDGFWSSKFKSKLLNDFDDDFDDNNDDNNDDNDDNNNDDIFSQNF